MSKKQSAAQSKKIDIHSAEIVALQYRVDEITRLLKLIRNAIGKDESVVAPQNRSKKTRISSGANTTIANILNISYEECVSTPAQNLLDRLVVEKEQSKDIAIEKLNLVSVLSDSLLDLANIRKNKKT